MFNKPISGSLHLRQTDNINPAFMAKAVLLCRLACFICSCELALTKKVCASAPLDNV
jgi:hypothetical protein